MPTDVKKEERQEEKAAPDAGKVKERVLFFEEKKEKDPPIMKKKKKRSRSGSGHLKEHSPIASVKRLRPCPAPLEIPLIVTEIPLAEFKEEILESGKAPQISDPLPMQTPVSPLDANKLFEKLKIIESKIGEFAKENISLKEEVKVLKQKVEVLSQENSAVKCQLMEVMNKGASPGIRAPPSEKAKIKEVENATGKRAPPSAKAKTKVENASGKRAPPSEKMDVDESWTTVARRGRRKVRNPKLKQKQIRQEARPPVPLRPQVNSYPNLTILEDETCRQFGVKKLGDLQGAQLLTKGGRQVVPRIEGVIRNHHGLYAVCAKKELAEHWNRGPSNKGYYNRLQVVGGPKVYHQIKNTSARNCPPGPLACWHNSGYASYVPGKCYISLLDVALVPKGSNEAKVLDRLSIQKRLRKLDSYVGASSWAGHARRAALLRKKFRSADF